MTFQPSLMFDNKAGAYPSEASWITFKVIHAGVGSCEPYYKIDNSRSIIDNCKGHSKLWRRLQSSFRQL
jgi:hypothetical protein